VGSAADAARWLAKDLREIATSIVDVRTTEGQTLLRAADAIESHAPEGRSPDPLAARVRELESACPLCAHDWSRHDPEDGCCDAHSNESIGVCECGRDMAWMHRKTAALSRAALAAAHGMDGRLLAQLDCGCEIFDVAGYAVVVGGDCELDHYRDVERAIEDDDR
jgi:hypothetical protein